MDFWTMRSAAIAAGEPEWGWAVETWDGHADRPPQRFEFRFRAEAMAFLGYNDSAFMATVYGPGGAVIVRRLSPAYGRKYVSTCATGLLRESSRSVGAGL